MNSHPRHGRRSIQSPHQRHRGEWHGSIHTAAVSLYQRRLRYHAAVPTGTAPVSVSSRNTLPNPLLLSRFRITLERAGRLIAGWRVGTQRRDCKKDGPCARRQVRLHPPLQCLRCGDCARSDIHSQQPRRVPWSVSEVYRMSSLLRRRDGTTFRAVSHVQFFYDHSGMVRPRNRITLHTKAFFNGPRFEHVSGQVLDLQDAQVEERCAARGRAIQQLGRHGEYPARPASRGKSSHHPCSIHPSDAAPQPSDLTPLGQSARLSFSSASRSTFVISHAFVFVCTRLLPVVLFIFSTAVCRESLNIALLLLISSLISSPTRSTRRHRWR